MLIWDGPLQTSLQELLPRLAFRQSLHSSFGYRKSTNPQRKRVANYVSKQDKTAVKQFGNQTQFSCKAESLT
eukprot:2226820-Amphidinium_carterae.1